jgi:hypothetical protein
MNRLTSVILGLVLGLCVQAFAHADNTTSTSSSSMAASMSASGAVNAPTTALTVQSTSPDSVTYRGAYTIITAPPVAAPTLTTTLTDTCMGSASGGLSVPGGGISLGKTTVDEDCVARLHARQLVAMHSEALAMEILCSRSVVREADLRMPKEKRVCSANLSTPEKAAAADASKVAIKDGSKKPVMPGQ